jgi:hypothetical protein
MAKQPTLLSKECDSVGLNRDVNVGAIYVRRLLEKQRPEQVEGVREPRLWKKVNKLFGTCNMVRIPATVDCSNFRLI